MYKFWFTLFFSVGISVGTIVIATAQDSDSTCPALVQTAIENVEMLCSDTGRNQVCYGNNRVAATQRDDTVSVQFDSPGDIAQIIDIEALHLSGMQLDVGEWGVALMRVQANLPDTLPGQNVTFVMFGEVTITDAEQPLITLSATVIASGAINVRGGPSTSDSIVGQLTSGTEITAVGRNASGNWLQIQLPEDDTLAWVATSLVRIDGDDSALRIVESDTPTHAPMQVFYLQTGIGDSRCNESPNSGLLIQTPQGVGTIAFTINEVEVTLGSTAFIQAQPGSTMTINVIEGQAQVEAHDVSRIVPAGASVSVPLDNDSAASDPPGDVEPYASATLQALPAQLLPEVVEVAPPASEDAIGALDFCTVFAATAVNLRGGPGTNYQQQGTLTEEINTRVTGQAEGTDGFIWWWLGDSNWVRSDLITTEGNCGAVPTIDATGIIRLTPDISDDTSQFTVEVPSSVVWVDTGIALTAGQPFSLRATGSANLCGANNNPNCDDDPEINRSIGPDGNLSWERCEGQYGPCQLTPGIYGALVSRIGSGSVFHVGAGGEYVANSDGTLLLGINDSKFWDNTGSYTVTIIFR